MDMTIIAGIANGVRILNDVVKANSSLRNFNELIAAVSEVNTQLISAQAAVLAAYQEEMTQTKRIGELEEKIMRFENWEREAERYQLTTIALNVQAYVMKPGMENGEAPHNLCANCFARKEKSFLQNGPRGTGIVARCKCGVTYFG